MGWKSISANNDKLTPRSPQYKSLRISLVNLYLEGNSSFTPPPHTHRGQECLLCSNFKDWRAFFLFPVANNNFLGFSLWLLPAIRSAPSLLIYDHFDDKRFHIVDANNPTPFPPPPPSLEITVFSLFFLCIFCCHDDQNDPVHCSLVLVEDVRPSRHFECLPPPAPPPHLTSHYIIVAQKMMSILTSSNKLRLSM